MRVVGIDETVEDVIQSGVVSVALNNITCMYTRWLGATLLPMQGKAPHCLEPADRCF